MDIVSLLLKKAFRWVWKLPKLKWGVFLRHPVHNKLHIDSVNNIPSMKVKVTNISAAMEVFSPLSLSTLNPLLVFRSMCLGGGLNILTIINPF